MEEIHLGGIAAKLEQSLTSDPKHNMVMLFKLQPHGTSLTLPSVMRQVFSLSTQMEICTTVTFLLSVESGLADALDRRDAPPDCERCLVMY
jgi:hypothetical protein